MLEEVGHRGKALRFHSPALLPVFSLFSDWGFSVINLSLLPVATLFL